MVSLALPLYIKFETFHGPKCASPLKNKSKMLMLVSPYTIFQNDCRKDGAAGKEQAAAMAKGHRWVCKRLDMPHAVST